MKLKRSNVEDIWKLFSTDLKRFVANRVSNPGDVDDIFQEVFIKIHSNIDSLKDEHKLSGWVYEITRNTIIDYYRKRHRPTEELYENIPDLGDVEHEENAVARISPGLRTMIDELPEKYRSALILTEFEYNRQRCKVLPAKRRT